MSDLPPDPSPEPELELTAPFSGGVTMKEDGVKKCKGCERVNRVFKTWLSGCAPVRVSLCSTCDGPLANQA